MNEQMRKCCKRHVQSDGKDGALEGARVALEGGSENDQLT
jgi:hypothetical protein